MTTRNWDIDWERLESQLVRAARRRRPVPASAAAGAGPWDPSLLAALDATTPSARAAGAGPMLAAMPEPALRASVIGKACPAPRPMARMDCGSLDLVAAGLLAPGPRALWVRTRLGAVRYGELLADGRIKYQGAVLLSFTAFAREASAAHKSPGGAWSWNAVHDTASGRAVAELRELWRARRPKGDNGGWGHWARNFKTKSTAARKLKNVYRAGKRWQARVKHHNQSYYLGIFDDPQVGAVAADYKLVALGAPPNQLSFPLDYDRYAAAVMAGSLDEVVPQPKCGNHKNTLNKKKGQSGYRGVLTMHATKTAGVTFRMALEHNTVRHSCCRGGARSFATAEAAARAYDRLSVELGRDKDWLNFPGEFDAIKASVDEQAAEAAEQEELSLLSALAAPPEPAASVREQGAGGTAEQRPGGQPPTAAAAGDCRRSGRKRRRAQVAREKDFFFPGWEEQFVLYPGFADAGIGEEEWQEQRRQRQRRQQRRRDSHELRGGLGGGAPSKKLRAAAKVADFIRRAHGTAVGAPAEVQRASNSSGAPRAAHPRDGQLYACEHCDFTTLKFRGWTIHKTRWCPARRQAGLSAVDPDAPRAASKKLRAAAKVAAFIRRAHGAAVGAPTEAQRASTSSGAGSFDAGLGGGAAGLPGLLDAMVDGDDALALGDGGGGGLGGGTNGVAGAGRAESNEGRAAKPEAESKPHENKDKGDGAVGREFRHKEAIQMLKDWMFHPDNVSNPYPSNSQKEGLVQETGLSKRQIDTWFVNARKRFWAPKYGPTPKAMAPVGRRPEAMAKSNGGGGASRKERSDKGRKRGPHTTAGAPSHHMTSAEEARRDGEYLASEQLDEGAGGEGASSRYAYDVLGALLI
jgi:hypothetical protein